MAEKSITNHKYNIKEILFSRAIPKYVTNETTDGHKIYSCKSCGDGFILESSYQEHILRKSILITYKCRFCSKCQTFYNRCDLLSHIRSHTFEKTATVYINDISIDPLPLSFFQTPVASNTSPLNVPLTTTNSNVNNGDQLINHSFCPECNKDITRKFKLFQDRAIHFRQCSNQEYSCPICSYNLPSVCGLRAHMRIHLNLPPTYCPDCGIHLSKKMITYPYTHGCRGFEMMRTNIRIRCPVFKCGVIFHPNDYKNHMMNNHIKKVYSEHSNSTRPINFYGCDCLAKYMVKSKIDQHLNLHLKDSKNNVFPCWICLHLTFDDVIDLISHHLLVHNKGIDDVFKNILRYVVEKKVINNETTKKIKYSKRKSKVVINYASRESLLKEFIVCPLCNYKVDQSWHTIKRHFALNHKDHVCKDAKILIPRIDVKRYMET